ncbi:GNAT family N-acetyltransferase [Aquibacillus sp. LR5S19]|uniref:GNAT family N-acetyltransferase n=1 Tax=Aquibacillus rhizosphaerae TaxID=3051431 RepID=A0ABT7LB57_9BACI|nr:GNAT family N-acetyltransferase [Aquibacillus sp. LR5S19]MDL4843103.1 GNAT family N-acetyltransferase [Aquibacillus sp. LR5S19]
MHIRNLDTQDFQRILPLVDNWWDGRKMSHLLPRFLFEHFQNTSFVIEKQGEIIGFLIGFLSQSNVHSAYIHFIGIDPNYRRAGLASELYTHFFQTVEKYRVKTVHCITSPINKKSIEYHMKTGFSILLGDQNINGLDVHSNYDGEGNDRVVFVKHL